MSNQFSLFSLQNKSISFPSLSNVFSLEGGSEMYGGGRLPSFGKVIHRGKRTAGWGKNAPTKGKQRAHLKDKCGSKCFLRPKNKGFPICSKSCSLNCRGLYAAKSRAGQYNYSRIESIASKLLDKYCR